MMKTKVTRYVVCTKETPPRFCRGFGYTKLVTGIDRATLYESHTYGLVKMGVEKSKGRKNLVVRKVHIELGEIVE